MLFWKIYSQGSSRRQQRTGKPGVLQSTGSQRVRHDWTATTTTILRLSRHTRKLGDTLRRMGASILLVWILVQRQLLKDLLRFLDSLLSLYCSLHLYFLFCSVMTTVNSLKCCVVLKGTKCGITIPHFSLCWRERSPRADSGNRNEESLWANPSMMFPIVCGDYSVLIKFLWTEKREKMVFSTLTEQLLPGYLGFNQRTNFSIAHCQTVAEQDMKTFDCWSWGDHEYGISILKQK